MFLELGASPDDLSLLEKFYARIYDEAFPHPDEREPESRIAGDLERSGPDRDFHVVLALDGRVPLGGVIADYFSAAQAGVIEFLAIDTLQRNGGLGSGLATAAHDLLAADALAKGRSLRFVAAEVSLGGSSAGFWSKLGYRALDFAYVQPALGPGREPVHDLQLLVRCPEAPEAIRASDLRALVREYIRCAMRIVVPESCEEYRRMAAALEDRAEVRFLPG